MTEGSKVHDKAIDLLPHVLQLIHCIVRFLYSVPDHLLVFTLHKLSISVA